MASKPSKNTAPARSANATTIVTSRRPRAATDKQPARRGLRDGNHAFDRNPVRSRVAAALHRQLDDLLDCVRRDPAATVSPRGSAKRASITDLAVRVQATRALPPLRAAQPKTGFPA